MGACGEGFSVGLSSSCGGQSAGCTSEDGVAAVQEWGNQNLALENFNWGQRLLLPAIEAAANILLLEWQHDRYEEIEAERIGYIVAAQQEWCNDLNAIRAGLENVIDDVPEPAMYQPVSAAGEQMDTVTDNIELMCHNNAEYTRLIGKYHREHDMARACLLNPKYYEMSKITWCQIGDLLDGKLPTSDIMEIFTDSAEQAIATGRIGNSCHLTLRNLGISQLRAQSLGRQEQRLELQSMNQNISPLSRQGDLRSMELGPAERINWAIQQGQLLQNAMQNANNACAKKAPYLWHQMQIDIQNAVGELQLNAGKANLVNTFVPNYASVFASQVSDLAGGLVDGLFGTSGGGSSQTSGGGGCGGCK